MTKIIISINEAEHKALVTIATVELRSLSDQIHFLIRSDLISRGLLERVTTVISTQEQTNARSK